ncbi:hypothetical protein AVEN_101170-1 [Araneus ventricosus]|uniref:Uncharacterized protein n=1 Tax=Araneus ventricosus TaxID=182803 RepID=A0A4Y2DCS9_ARAVE|nr:hypothetical protein AVEN_101170-1 [Araneus ventricosus]
MSWSPGSLVVRPWLWVTRVPGSKPDFPVEPPCMRAHHTQNHMQCPNALLPVWCGSLERGCQAPSSSSDRGSKFRGLPQNSSLVASKRRVNVINPNLIFP